MNGNTSQWIPYRQKMRTSPSFSFIYNEDGKFEALYNSSDGFLVRNNDNTWARSFRYHVDANF